MEECKWLNKNFGEGYYVCNGLLKAVNEKICSECPNFLPKSYTIEED